MCDTVVVVSPGRVLFAKSSDRDPNEAQFLDWCPPESHPTGARLRCTWIEIPQATRTHAVLLSRPFWMWGAEMGANDQGVVIGNEAVFTKTRVAPIGLTGMDLLRLALERSSSAKEAVDTIIRLIEEHGQGGGCGYDNPDFTYHNGFMVADHRGAFVLETVGKRFEVETVDGARSISNALSIPGLARAESDRLKSYVARAEARRCRTQELAKKASGPRDMMALLRDHGGEGEPAYSLLTGAMGSPCMHAGGVLASSQTVASWVSELTAEGSRHWATGTAAPCTSLFKPVAVDQPLHVPSEPCGHADDTSLFWRHELLHRAVVTDHSRLLPLYAAERDEVETRWLEDPPRTKDAFAEGDRLLVDWTDRVVAALGKDRRPLLVRRHWRGQDAHAKLHLHGTGDSAKRR
ncbi:MAG: peptidase U34 [Polyangia bacterium]|nr:peptidase U34 [Polyangia bacterium]